MSRSAAAAEDQEVATATAHFGERFRDFVDPVVINTSCNHGRLVKVSA